MTLTVSTISGSPRGWRVLLGLAFKGLEAEIETLSLAEGEHKKEPFLSLNPRGTVPALRSEGVLLRDSVAILAWLDRRFPQKPLFGETHQDAALVWQLSMECRQYLRQATDALLTPVFFGGVSLEDQGSERWTELEAGATLMHMEMRWLDDLLSDGRAFLAGSAPSAADAIAWPELRLVQRATETQPDLLAALGFAELANALGHLEGWKARLAALPGVAQTMPDHWQADP